MEKRWIYPATGNEALVNQLAASLGISPLIARLLLTRGVAQAAEARQFLKPQLADLHDPFLLPDMARAIDRLDEALRQGQRIMVYGDYDVDGITATALLLKGLCRIGAQASWYLPNRSREGYGISPAGVDEAKARGAGLIVSVDCGITAHQEVAYASSLGIDCIVTDHHETKDSLPAAAAVVDPKRGDSAYPYQELAGVGVAYKMLQALYRRHGLPEADLEPDLDLVALGTIADIVPLTGENRILAKFGLEAIRSSAKPGIRALLEVAKLVDRPLDSGQIVFIMAPRINAAGRMGDAGTALQLLVTEDPQQAAAIARLLDEENKKRKAIDDQILESATAMVRSQIDLEREKVIVLSSADWHQGVIGIVASRLVEQFYRPTVLIAVDGDRGKGSARSIANFHLHEALKQCQELLLGFGGHKYAAGLTIDTSQIPAFRKKLNDVAAGALTPDDLLPNQVLDAAVDLDALDAPLARDFSLFAPFGPGNRHPVLVSYQTRIVGSPYIVGNNHLKFKVKQKHKIFDSIGFSFGDLLPEIEDPDAAIDLAFVLEENEWQGRKKLQLRVKDIKVH
ncbi:MAG TPA: single-stranded-DNA-specific exonuclease RecJ [Candidatus Edwardsbacteria bacterium]|nr:single-stranded-DNA-specific exonuclease RecJ [Candidatus Edwardsbacteria bacterium]